MALRFGAYAWPTHARTSALLAVIARAAVNLAGVTKTVLLTRVILVVVLVALTLVVVACLFGGESSLDHIGPVGAAGPRRTLQSAGLLFFAFAGYARIATLGEEVRDPARTIPRAVPIALGITLGVYALVAFAALVAVGPASLAAAKAPLAAAVAGGDLHALAPAVRVGGSVASLGVLLSLLLGVSRTTFAMAAEGDLPPSLAAIHPRTQVPYRAELALAAVVLAVVVIADVRGAIGFSSFAVLAYYAIANASAFTLPRTQRRGPRVLPLLGVLGCVTLAATLPARSTLPGAGVLVVGALVFAARGHRGRGYRPSSQEE
jgi:APA family basic amino acid/polyamine antiporter